MVDDQIGAPTWSRAIAARPGVGAGGEPARRTAGDVAAAAAIAGLYHPTAAGETTWCGFAEAIVEAVSRRRGTAFTAPRLVPIATQDYPLPARRPANSLLSGEKLARTFGVRLAPWREALEEAVSELA